MAIVGAGLPATPFASPVIVNDGRGQARSYTSAVRPRPLPTGRAFEGLGGGDARRRERVPPLKTPCYSALISKATAPYGSTSSGMSKAQGLVKLSFAPSSSRGVQDR